MSSPLRIVYTAGVFDLLHRGHLNLLARSRLLGDLLVVGVVSDAGARAYKGQMPVQSLPLRMDALLRLPLVDVVVPQPTTDPSALLERFRPDIMTHGDDWTELREGHETLERLGIEWRLIPYTPGISTTLLREAV
jgi:rfaE bifunctional protein nucleotidyltransferase chain/domain